ncbi:hypothetical protein BGW36DRAFT_287786 [Talaromyces proteolyticus]|uniref:Zn(2)-C6 fungal-type domain-containing protein n=1 Tax=Talaromyces proteolyticus TaxID=1131652 RepID=A0AAD4Q4U6_9EURO|nr:uncharacterized protein BGW36DRAFT_287786 [Talaromyces proteolyticus]KAH8703489.1 hypothetical protein BGW36DRAFT_287786 [Talaromyces proteolyticus]
MRQQPAAGFFPSPSNSQDITFLPVNQSHSPGNDRPRRGYQSCDNCRQKKKRCEPSSTEVTCLRCQQESRVCRTTHQRKRKKLRPVVGSTTSDVSGNADVATPCATPTAETSPRDIRSLAADQGSSTLEVVSTHCGDLHWRSNTKEQILSTNILDACDALDLITVAGSNEITGKKGRGSLDLHESPNVPSQPPASVNPAREPSATSWDRFFLVKRGIIRAHEAVEYLSFYFAQLWHLFPIIPQWYSLPARYGILAAEEPVLTISLVTIASRYHPLSGFNGQARSERIHWRTWPWVQRLFQSSIWGSSAMRSLGSIAAMLLFIEWHPRAINSPEDLVGDCGDLELFEPHSQISDDEATGIAESYGRPDPSSTPERLNIVAPAYRSNKMSWMLLSTAISLAQEIGCLGDEQVLAQASSRGLSERSSVRKEWTRLLCTFIRLTDEALALRLRLEPQLASSCSVEIDRLASSLIADGLSESAVDLAPHMRKARELLHSWRKNQQGTGPVVPITAWDSFKRGLDCWERKRHLCQTGELSTSCLSLRGACLDIEYYYTRLCGLSPAAHMFESSPKIYSSNSYIKSLSEFAEEATKASVNMLELIVQIFSSSEPFRYAAVRYWLYTLCASLTEQLDSTNPSIDLIMRVINGMKQYAPDDIHMSQRYAALLEILINAALRTSQMTTARGNGMDYSSHSSPYPMGIPIFESNELDVGEDWIYDSNFWETLPDMVGLNTVPNLITSSFE